MASLRSPCSVSGKIPEFDCVLMTLLPSRTESWWPELVRRYSSKGLLNLLPIAVVSCLQCLSTDLERHLTFLQLPRTQPFSAGLACNYIGSSTLVRNPRPEPILHRPHPGKPCILSHEPSAHKWEGGFPKAGALRNGILQCIWCIRRVQPRAFKA